MWSTAGNVLSCITNTYRNNEEDTVNLLDLKKQDAFNESQEVACPEVELPEFDPSKWCVDNFEFGRYLGDGKFGHVYLVREKDTKFILALKVISKHQLRMYQLTDSLKREIEILKYCQHENIVSFYGFFQNHKRVYMMLEWAPYGDLYGLLKKQPDRRFNEKQAATIIKQVTLALGYLHSKHVLHRDIKPENILCFHNDVYKISDFGWSVHTNSMRRKTMCGTLDYLCPEIIQNRIYDERVDIWTIGVLTYELVTGRPPFETDCEDKTKRRIVQGMYTCPTYLSQNCQDFIKGILMQDCNRRPPIHKILAHPWLN